MPLLRFALGVPAFKGLVADGLIDMAMNLATLSLMSQTVAGPEAFDPRVVGGPVALQFAGRMRQDTCSIAKSRNRLLWRATGFAVLDWLVMCDADTHVRDERGCHAILRMLAEGAQQNAAVIGAPVMARHGLYNFIMPGRILPPPRSDLYGKVFAVERIGTAFMAINLAWIRKHWPDGHKAATIGWLKNWLLEHPGADESAGAPSRRWFAFEAMDVEGGEPEEKSEDYSFCDGVRERGGLILADWRFEPHHEGAPYPIAPPTKLDPRKEQAATPRAFRAPIEFEPEPAANEG